MQKIIKAIGLLTVCSSLLVGCGTNNTVSKQEIKKEEIKKEKIVMGFSSSTQSIDEVEKSAKILQKKLSEKTKIDVEIKVDASYEELMQDMKDNKVDLGFLNSSSYVKVKENTDIDVLVKGIRFGKDYYRAQYNVRYDSKIKSIDEIVKSKKLKWAYPDKTSTAGYLFPALQMMEKGADLNNFVAVETSGHDSALKSLLNGDVDFATTFEDARSTIIKEYPDVNKKIKVIGYSDKIPNDNAAISSKVKSKTKEKIKKALLEFSEDKEAIEALNSLYGWSGVTEAKDSDYDIVRALEKEFPQE